MEKPKLELSKLHKKGLKLISAKKSLLLCLILLLFSILVVSAQASSTKLNMLKSLPESVQHFVLRIINSNSFTSSPETMLYESFLETSQNTSVNTRSRMLLFFGNDSLNLIQIDSNINFPIRLSQPITQRRLSIESELKFENIKQDLQTEIGKMYSENLSMLLPESPSKARVVVYMSESKAAISPVELPLKKGSFTNEISGKWYDISGWRINPNQQKPTNVEGILANACEIEKYSAQNTYLEFELRCTPQRLIEALLNQSTDEQKLVRISKLTEALTLNDLDIKIKASKQSKLIENIIITTSSKLNSPLKIGESSISTIQLQGDIELYDYNIVKEVEAPDEIQSIF